MFSDLLKAVESNCPNGDMRLTLEQHRDLLDKVLPWLSIDSEPLIGAAKALFGESVFNSSKLGIEYTTSKPDQDGLIHVPISVGFIYIRPENGCHGVSLNLTALRCFTSRRKIHRPSVNIELEILNLEAKKIFESLYRDYRGQINRLLEQAQIQFFTSYCSGIVGKSKSNKLSVKFDEYLSDPDVDNDFSLSKSCPSGTSYSAAIRAFLALSVLYVACCAGLTGKSARILLEKNLMILA